MIHLFVKHGVYFVLDVNSGSLHVLTRLAYDILSVAGDCPDEMPERVRELAYPAAELEEAYEELLSLKAQGLLFAPELNVGFPKIEQVPVKAMCLHVAHDCNMRCRYCFASAGEYNGCRSLMSADIGCKAIDFLLAHSASRRNLEVDFFGGEPLLAFDTVKAVTSYGNERAGELGKTIRFTMTTNGALLDDETIRWLNENMFNVVLSLDGRRDVNDSMRHFVDGSGTYDAIVPAFRKLTSERPSDKSCYVRGTFTRRNLDFAEDVLHMAELGFTDVSVEPVSLPENDPISIRHEDVPAVCREYDRLAAILAARDDLNFFHFNVALDDGPCVYKRVKGCGAGSEYVAVTPNGDMYPCHQFAGEKDFLLGNVLTGFAEGSDKVRSAFLDTNIYTKPQCRDCFAKFFCGGGCCAASYHDSGDIAGHSDIACELERYRLECALYLQAVRENMT